MGDPIAAPADIGARIRSFLSDEVILDDGVNLTDTTPLLSGLVDSTGLMELVAFLEDEFGISLDYGDVDAANFRTVAAIAELVGRKVRET